MHMINDYIERMDSSAQKSQKTDLYHQCHWRIQPPAPQSYQKQIRFPTDDSLFKMLYLAMIDITKKWTGRRQDW